MLMDAIASMAKWRVDCKPNYMLLLTSGGMPKENGITSPGEVSRLVV